MTKLVLTAFGALLLFGSCASPTQIVLHLHTDIPCTGDRWKGVDVTVGEPNAGLESRAPTSSTGTCDANGEIGTLVLTPSGSKDSEIGLRIVAGLDRVPEQCVEHDYRGGCVVARRAVRFDRHSTVHVDVLLAKNCIDFGCEAGSTCLDGVCRPLAEVPNDPAPRGGAGGAGGTSGASNDAGRGGAAPVSPGAGSVRCGDTGLLCPTSGNVCCVAVDPVAGTSTGSCRPQSECPPENVVLLCDDENDCAAKADDRGFPGLCLLTYTDAPNAGNSTTPGVVSGSDCAPYSYLESIAGKAQLGLCNDRNWCMNGTIPCLASSTSLPNYKWCSEVAPFIPPNPGMDRVRCGDGGVTCGTSGDVCCLTVDSEKQTSTGVCRPASTCPTASAVLECDDASDCPGEAPPSRQAGVCALLYEWGPDGPLDAGRVSGSTCMTFENWFARFNVGYGLCDRTGKCMDQFACKDEHTASLPNYFMCRMNDLPSGERGAGSGGAGQ